MSRRNGGIVGPVNTPVGGIVTGLAGGVWRMNDVLTFVSNSQWPKVPESIDNSCRFNDNDSPNLSRTPSSASSRTTWTWSAWIKRSNITGGQMALLIIVVSLSLLGLLNRSWKKNFKKEVKLSN